MSNEVRRERKRDTLGPATHKGRVNKNNMPSFIC